MSAVTAAATTACHRLRYADEVREEAKAAHNAGERRTAAGERGWELELERGICY